MSYKPKPLNDCVCQCHIHYLADGYICNACKCISKNNHLKNINFNSILQQYREPMALTRETPNRIEFYIIDVHPISGYLEMKLTLKEENNKNE